MAERGDALSEHDARDRWAWMFPGQGGQFVGMSRALFSKYPHAREIGEEAEAVTGLPLLRLARQGPAVELARPEVLEPLLAATSIAYVDILHGAGIRPSVVAGFSAGEVGALYAAGVLTRVDALRVACWRGELLRAAAETFPGGMNAVRGLDTHVVRRAAADADGRVAIAAINAPRHVTITGVHEDLDQLSHTLARGRRRVASGRRRGSVAWTVVDPGVGNAHRAARDRSVPTARRSRLFMRHRPARR